MIPVENDGVEAYLKAAAERLLTSAGELTFHKLLFKGLESQNLDQFYYKVSISVTVKSDFENKTENPLYIEPVNPIKTPSGSKERPVVVGFGPAGMFAALELLEFGLKPIIFERGKKIEDRHFDIKNFTTKEVLDPESNIQFGEGGAGSYSDGKLFARAKNSVYIEKVLDTYMKFGAPEEIGYMARPHLGTDVLCKIVKNIRNYIIEQGGEVHFGSKLTDIVITDNKVKGIIINGTKEFIVSSLYLAIGHSARDTFELLHKKGIMLEQKAIAVGIRVEHPVDVVNLMKYGKKYQNFPGLGAATYSFNYSNEQTQRRLNTFCMCPGGEVVNASSEPGCLVVNGMSYSKRDAAFSNTAFIITCPTTDYPSTSPIAGIEFQRQIEQKAYLAGGAGFKVPAQNLMDFLEGKTSSVLNTNSCKIGTKSADIKQIFPEQINNTLLEAFKSWQKDYPLFVSKQGILMAPETRTSCAVRVTRKENYESVNIEGLYPIGEGAGYSGGITSSAADGIRAVESKR